MTMHVPGGYDDDNFDSNRSELTAQIDQESASIEAKIVAEMSKGQNEWFDCFRTRLTIVNNWLALSINSLGPEKYSILKKRYDTLQQEVCEAWKVGTLTDSQKIAAIRKLASIKVEIPFQ